MKSDHRQNTVGPWAHQKLDALESYLLAYMNVMKNQHFFRLVFVDAFAGAGISKVRQATETGPAYPSFLEVEDAKDEEDFILGSPYRALGLPRPFDRYHFFDMDPRRVELLSIMKQEYPHLDIRPQVGDANALVQDVARHFERNDRGVAFLDPYGAHLRWTTLEALAATGRFDVIINFPLDMAINRLIRLDGDIPEPTRRQLDDCFGTSEWESLAYETTDTLFGDGRQKRRDARDRLRDFYVQRLRALFGNVAGPSLVSNTKGVGLYYLVWAGSKPRGRPIAKHILDLGAKVKVPAKRGTPPASLF